MYLGVRNTGAGRDVVVQAVIRRYSSDQLVDGLLLRSLAGVTGAATFATRWGAIAAASAGPGMYTVEVTLSDAAGELLDRRTVPFSLGIMRGEIAGFTATPQSFRPGAPVALSLTFKNTGSQPITATAVIRAQDAAGVIRQTFTHDLAVLPPDQIVRVDKLWDTAGLLVGAYRLIGYVRYAGQATAPAVLTLHMPGRLYLPLVLRR